MWEADAPVLELQRQVFATAYRALEPGGQLIFGSKNREWPSLAFRDAHTGRPLVNVLPRHAATWLSLRVTGKPYRHHVHSGSGWIGLIRSAGFRSAEILYPFFSYQLPILLERRPTLRSLIALHRLSKNEDLAESFNGPWRMKAALMALTGTVGHPVSHSVVIRAIK